MKRFLSTFGICLVLVEAFIFLGGYQLFDFTRRWYLAGAAVALVLAVLISLLLMQSDRMEALEKRVKALEERTKKSEDQKETFP